MKMPMTSWPCCLSSQALTAESTPPESPTTTRGLLLMVGRSASSKRGLSAPGIQVVEVGKGAALLLLALGGAQQAALLGEPRLEGGQRLHLL